MGLLNNFIGATENLFYEHWHLQIKTETATLDVLDSILDSISGHLNAAHEDQDIARRLPGFKIKEGKPTQKCYEL